MQRMSVAAWAAAVLVACWPPPDYVVTPGLVTISGMEEWAKNMDDPNVEPPVTRLEDTRMIPKPIQGLGGLGFRIDSDPDHVYTVYTVQRIPGMPLQLSGFEQVGFDEDSGVLTVRTKEVEVVGGRYFYWKPAAADPTGDYIIDIYVDDRLLETISFDVQDRQSGRERNREPMSDWSSEDSLRVFMIRMLGVGILLGLLWMAIR